MLQGLTPETHRGLLLSVGQRGGTRPLSPVEVGSGLKAALSAGTPAAELAAILHLDGSSMITRFVRLLELPAEVLHLVDWGQTDVTISFTAASEISRLKAHDDQVNLSRRALEAKLTTGEVKAVVQLRKRSRKALEECISEIMSLRTETVVRHVFLGGVTGEDLIAQLTARSQIERDKLLSDALTDLVPGANISGRLGADRFTLSAEDEDTARQLKALQDNLETSISALLSSALNTNKTQ